MSLAFNLPPAEDDQARRARDLQRAQMEQAAARSLEAAQIGAGGLTVTAGFIDLQAGSTLNVDGDATFNGSVTVPAGSLNTAGSISAGANVTAGATVQGASVVAIGTVSGAAVTASGEVTGNHATFAGGVNSLDVYNRLLTYGGPYASQYIHSDGNMGYVPSSGEFKQDVEMWACDPVIVSYLRVVSFRYIDAVTNLGDAAETEIGLIAEEVHDLGFHWLIDYAARLTDGGKVTPVPYAPEWEWRPFGVKYERLSLVLLVWAQSVIEWQQAIEARLAAAGI